MANNLNVVDLDGGSATKKKQTVNPVYPVQNMYVDTLLNQLKSNQTTPTTQNVGTPAYSSLMQNVGKSMAASSPYTQTTNVLNNQQTTKVPDVLNPSTYSGTSQPTVTPSAPQAEATTQSTYSTPANTSTGGSAPVTSTNDYQALLTQLYEQQQARAREQQELLAKQAQSAYENNMASLSNAFNARNAALLSNYNNALNSLLGSYNQSKEELGQSAENALREAYVNRMMSERNLGQQLAARGMSGGASESAIANLINQYGSNRNTIERELGNNLYGLETLYNQNKASAEQAYNNALEQSVADRANYEMQLRNDLENYKANSYANMYSSLTNLDNTYLSNIADLLASQQSYNQNMTLAQAKTDTELAKAAAATANGNWLTGFAQAELDRGVPANNVAAALARYGATAEEITDILNVISQ